MITYGLFNMDSTPKNYNIGKSLKIQNLLSINFYFFEQGSPIGLL
jgi:hypothetical protein